MSAVADAQAAASSSRAAGSFTRRVSSRRPRDVAMTGMTGRRARSSARPRGCPVTRRRFSEIVRTSATTVSRERTSTRVTHDARSRRDALGRFAASIAGFLTFESATGADGAASVFRHVQQGSGRPDRGPDPGHRRDLRRARVHRRRLGADRALLHDVPAPTFPCDLSQLNTKASTRIQPALGARAADSVRGRADPYAVQDILQSVTQTESMLKSNNARVKVDFEGPKTYLELVDTSIVAFLEEVPAEKVAEGKGLRRLRLKRRRHLAGEPGVQTRQGRRAERGPRGDRVRRA